MQICTVPTVLTARRQLAAARYVEVAEWLSAANKVENLDLGCLRRWRELSRSDAPAVTVPYPWRTECRWL